jgi:hypothetical protein
MPAAPACAKVRPASPSNGLAHGSLPSVVTDDDHFDAAIDLDCADDEQATQAAKAAG